MSLKNISACAILFYHGTGSSVETHHFVVVYFFQVGIEWIRESGGDKVGSSVVRNALGVELALQILQSESIVQNRDIASRRRFEVLCDFGALLKGMGGNEAGSKSKDWDERVTHFEHYNWKRSGQEEEAELRAEKG